MSKKIKFLTLVLFVIFGLTACDIRNEDIYAGGEIDSAKMFAAFDKFTEINSYIETAHSMIFTDGVQKIDQKYIIKYQKKDNDLLAEGYSTLNNEVTSYIYIKDNYKYIKLANAEMGIKFFLENKGAFDSISESTEFLSDEFKQMTFDLTVKKTKNNTTIYSFKFIEDITKVAEYKITIETLSNRLIEMKTKWYNTMDLSTITSCTVNYEYKAVIVTLPDNLYLYEEIL